jgi:hypothetical protein
MRPVRAGATQSTGPAAAFAVDVVGAPVAKAAASARGPARFRLSVPGRALRPGVYRLEVSAAEAGTTLGRLHIVRRVTVR